MKYLKKIFEADKNTYVNYAQSNLQSAIDAYNTLLIKDEVWKNFYHKIDRYDLKSKDPKFLNDICEFGENRLKEIKKEKEEDLQLVKDLVTDYLEDCESINPDEFKVIGVNTTIGYEIELTLVFSKKCMKDRRGVDRNFRITENEIMDYWENLIDLFKVLKSNGFESNIRYYQPNGVEMKIIIERKDEN
jgi:hypothetical protein